ncbi:MAG: glycosyltransferase family 4 protein [Rhodospirillales bacterium]|jgi:glycosyltransferase involved in cell wall biosynthesis|nr:glycosyltransferase family 4 protein [Rhodospirillales bacterium]
MEISLFAAAPFSARAGGHAYARHLTDGLRAAGHTVRLVALPGAHPLPDAPARAAALAAWAALPAGNLPVIDGLILPAFAGHGDALAARPAVGLIHHPTALDPGHSDSDRAGLRNTELRLLPRLARVVVTSGATAARLAAEFGVDPARIAVVVPGTDDAVRSTGSDRSGAGDPGCAILSVGALTPRKGHDVLIRALARLFDLDWRLTVVGPARDAAHAGALRALVAALRVEDRVRFAGETDDPTLETLWREADLFALASWWEGYGTAVAEALKRGLPVAVTSGGSAAALVPPEAGVVCQPGDIDQLSKALRRVIFDVPLRREMADAACQAGRTLPAWPAQVAAFADELRKVAGRPESA